MDSFEYPLHFIDFETSTCAIPFYEQQRPYETVAFQFSHHTMDRKGVIEHKSQYIKLERGEFPNFEFVHELKKALEQDNGTVFRFSHHENTVLVAIKRQLLEADLPSTEKTDLINFIDSITQEPKIKRIGERNMVDMCQMVKDNTDFVVYDAKTGEDITRQVLTQIIVEEEGKGGQNLLPIGFLRQLIGFYGDNMQYVVPRYLDYSMRWFSSNQDQVRKYMSDAFGGLFPFGQLEEMGKQNMAMFERAMRMMMPFSGQGADAPPRPDAPKPASPPDAELTAMKNQL
ncbi:MAG: DUF2779 domain-containing protein, partial [Bacteroidetes bacterium]|nr:DUF2779 domain-containing protein [Bacteroidota bacterium]